MQPIPHPNDAPNEIWLRPVSWSQRYSCLKVWTDGRTHGQRLESHPISSPWAFGSGKGSGELKMNKLEWSQNFTIITLWELSVVMETRVLIRSGPKHNTDKPPPQWCSRWNLITISQLFIFESVVGQTSARVLGRQPPLCLSLSPDFRKTPAHQPSVYFIRRITRSPAFVLNAF